jgi:tetratricopeptide (TPR) repeat protein
MKGLALSGLSQREEAIKCYEEAHRINPQNTLAWKGKGSALGLLGKDDEAIECFNKAIEINENDGEAWYCKRHRASEPPSGF